MAKRNGWGLDVSQKWLLLSIALVILSLSRPVIPQKPLEIEQAGRDVILAIDLSYSMRGTDVAPSRLEEAKKILIETVRTHPKDRFGVIGFTTHAIVLSPLTKDTELLEHLLGALDETQIITKGTDVMSALELSRKMSHANMPLVILLTDGGDEVNYNKEAQFSQDNKLRVNIVMLASRSGSTLLTDEGNTLKDEKGHIVVSARNDAINEIASASEGSVVSTAQELNALIDDAGVDDFTGSSSVSDNQELFTFALGLALVAFVLSQTMLGEKISKLLVIILAFIGISANATVLDFAYLHTASQEYNHKNYEYSAQLFEKINSNEADYNCANALYKAGKYQEALTQYRRIRSQE
ncbi:VWA domain-containing protein, partial [bacterium]|nr:VWA domain-containing protein [bacterium]